MQKYGYKVACDITEQYLSNGKIFGEDLAVDLRGEEGELQKRMMSSTEELLKEDIKRNDLKDGIPLKKPPQPLPDKNESDNRKKDKKTMGCCGTSDCTLM